MFTKLITMADTNKKGYPFSAALYYKGKVYTAVNTVTSSNDPTAHAEVNVIRKVCRKLKTISLKGALLVSSGEPCPMCLTAIAWAGIKYVVYARDYKTAQSQGFTIDTDSKKLNEFLNLGLQLEKSK